MGQRSPTSSRFVATWLGCTGASSHCSGSWRPLTRPCAGTVRGCTAVAGGITIWCSPTGSSPSAKVWWGPISWRVGYRARTYGGAGFTTWFAVAWAGRRQRRRWRFPPICKRVWSEIGPSSEVQFPTQPEDQRSHGLLLERVDDLQIRRHLEPRRDPGVVVNLDAVFVPQRRERLRALLQGAADPQVEVPD